jgi:hypothetical protein
MLSCEEICRKSKINKRFKKEKKNKIINEKKIQHFS